MIGDDIEIVFVKMTDWQTRVGILAPPNVPVHRREIYNSLKYGNCNNQTILKYEVKENNRNDCML